MDSLPTCSKEAVLHGERGIGMAYEPPPPPEMLVVLGLGLRGIVLHVARLERGVCPKPVSTHPMGTERCELSADLPVNLWVICPAPPPPPTPPHPNPPFLHLHKISEGVKELVVGDRHTPKARIVSPEAPHPL